MGIGSKCEATRKPGYSQSALRDAARDGVRGADVTPYLLAAVARQTGGKTLDANLGLLESNARLAAEIAVQLAKTR